MKNPKGPAIRIFGQRAIAASFLNRCKNLSEDCRGNPSKKVDKCAPLSDFLDRKLRKSVLYKPLTAEEKARPFTPLVRSKCLAVFPHGYEDKKQTEEEDKIGGALETAVLRQFMQKEKQISGEEGSNVLDKVSLEQFKENSADKMDHIAPFIIDVEDDALVKEEKISRKRNEPFEGMDMKERTRKPVLVLGEKPNGSNTIPKRRARSFSCSSNSSKKHRPAYNHYANGSGWWDCDMEGIDSEEVGFGEVWEGVGSTTFGEIIDWH